MKIRNLSPAITNSSEQIRKIAESQIGYHRTNKFSQLLRENEKLLLDLLGCRNGKAIFLTSSGTGAMDAVVANLISDSDKVLIINGGDFGERWCRICDFYKLSFFEFKPGFGKNIDFKKLEENFEMMRPTIVLTQHNETSSGQLHDIKSIGNLCSRYGCRLVVDAISSIANDYYHMDDWHVDVTILSSQKGLALSPGISLIALNEKIFNSEFAKRNFYFDFKKYLGELTDVGLPFTPNMIALNQLNYRLKEINEKGIKTEIEKRREQAEDFRNRIRNLPLKVIAETPSNAVTGLYTEREDVKDFFEKVQEKGIYFSPSGGKEGKKFVVGHMGDLTSEDNEFFVTELKNWLQSEPPKKEEVQDKKQKIVFTSGTFDMFHVGHLNILRRSKALGTKLIVAVSTDELVRSYKGTPVIPFEQRIEIIKACKYVDEVIPQEILTDIKYLKKYNVDIITLGSDWKDKYLEGMEWAKQNGIEVVYLPYTEGVSTTNICKEIIKNGYDIAFSHGKRGVPKIF